MKNNFYPLGCETKVDLGKFLLLLIGLLSALCFRFMYFHIAHATDVPVNPTWYNASWTYRRPITIDHTKVGAPLANYPLLINISSDSGLASHALANGNDILFTSSDGRTLLNFEIEKYDGSTGSLQAWVQIPRLSNTTDTNIYMYYGNSGASSSLQNKSATWKGNYVGVWHLAETSGTQYDSTSNGNNSSTVSVTAEGTATGQIDGADQFNGSSTYVQVNGLMGSPNSVTLSAWASMDSGGGSGEVISLGDHVVLRVDDSAHGGATGIYNDGSDWRYTTSNTIYAGTGLHYFTYVIDGVSHTQTIYVDGVQKGQTNYTGAISYLGLGSNTFFGKNGNSSSYYFTGVIDEPRVSNIARSADWIATEYNNQNSPSTFYTVFPQEQVNVSSLFITVNGSNFYLNGNPIKLIGFNSGLATANYPTYTGCGWAYSDADVDGAFAQLHAHGVSVIRIWITQLFTRSGTYLDRVNYLLSEAQKYNMYLIFTLENQWSACTEGGNKSTNWYQSGYLSPYGNYTLSYKDYVGQLVDLYKNQPNILMWELMNEPQARNIDNSCNFNALYNFASDMTDYVKSIDPNHLIGLGAVDSCITGDNYRQMHSLPHLDVLEDDDYGNPTVPLPGLSAKSDITVSLFVDATFSGASDSSVVILHNPPRNPGDQVAIHLYTPTGAPPDTARSLAADLQVAKDINKPFMLVEAGIYSNCSAADCYTENQRAAYFNAKINAFFDNGGSAYLIWSYVYNHTPTDMDVDYSDPLNNTLLSIASSLNAGAGLEAPEILLLLLPVFLAIPKAMLILKDRKERKRFKMLLMQRKIKTIIQELYAPYYSFWQLCVQTVRSKIHKHYGTPPHE